MSRRKCYTCEKRPANNEYRGEYYCDKCYKRIKWQYGGSQKEV